MMRWQGTTLGACIAVSFVLFAGSACAQEDAAAEALFNKGLSEMEAGRFETACPTLKESQRLDPRMGTLFTLAECEAKGGMIASAVAHYDEYLRLFGRLTPAQKAAQAGREKVSAAQKAALSPQVPYVTLLLRDAPAGTTVKWDDMVFHLPALGVPLPVNPGDHVVTTQAPGSASSVTRVTLEKAERKQVELKIGAPSSGIAKTAPSPVAPSPARPSGAPAAAEADAGSSENSRRVWVYGAAGLGVAGLVVGSITGAVVLGKKGTVDDNCEGTRCNAAGKEAADSAQTLGLVSTIGFGVGIAGLATATVLFFTEPKSAAASRTWAPLVADRRGGIVVGLEHKW
ncbi:MAG TPA: hypothetical protein VK550_33470 [Polyangiaceae bacterium]|nr:hypothetical protein [Polyangiaceae bacterium]